MAKQPKYKLKPEFEGKTTYAKAPQYKRGENPSKFILNECSQKDFHYLYRRGFNGVEVVAPKAEETPAD